jgi:hypothetical protein
MPRELGMIIFVFSWHDGIEAIEVRAKALR